MGSSRLFSFFLLFLPHYFRVISGVADERAAFSLHGIRNGRERTSIFQLN